MKVLVVGITPLPWKFYQALQKKHVFALSTGQGAHWLMPHSTHQWVAVAILLVAMLFGGITYVHHTQEHDLAHLDAEILTDDLPLEVFVD